MQVFKIYSSRAVTKSVFQILSKHLFKSLLFILETVSDWLMPNKAEFEAIS